MLSGGAARALAWTGLAAQLAATLGQAGLRLAGSDLTLPPPVLYGGPVLAGLGYVLLRSGPRRGAFFFGLVFAVTFAAESWAQVHGLFGVRYFYDPARWPGPLLRALPLLVPCMWFAGMVPSYEMSTLIWPRVPSPGARRWMRAAALALCGAGLMTLWDLLLDPVSVHQGLWRWEGGPYPYHDVPFENLAAWLIGTAGTHLLLRLSARPDEDGPPAGLGRADRALPHAVYALLGLLYLVLAHEAGLRLPAALMLGLGTLAALHARRGR